jgi:hypothetical protein
MKTKTVIFTALVQSLALSVFSQNVLPFAPAGSEWYYTYAWGCCPENHFNHIISEKDTLVDGNSCRVLKQYYDDSNTASEKYIIRQEGGKIYHYYQDRFNLLFDFDAEVNDTIKFTFRYKKFDNDLVLPHNLLLLQQDTVVSARFKVESITANAQNLKTFKTKVLDEDIPEFQLYYAPHTYIYTEKTGWHEEFMPMLDNAAHPDMDVFRSLRCYSEPGFSFSSDEWAATFLPCNHSIATGFDSPPKEESSIIYPNPFNDRLFTFTNDGGAVEIIDASGKTVYYLELTKGINEISTTHFLKGIYFIKIQDKDNSIRIFKIIKS